MEHAPVWLTYSLIYLAAAVIAVPLFKAIGLGTVMGYLAAGMAIGPWGLKLVSNVDDILHFAEFGVVLMLFLIGLELEPRRLWSLRRPIFGWGSAQVLACAAVMTAVAMLFEVRWKVALVASLGLALSSTAIALQALNERNLLRTASGEAGFSILLFQDVAAIPILAIVPLLGSVADRDDTSLLVEGLRVAGAIFAIIVGGRLLLRPLLRWIARSKTPEIFTATALLLVVGISAFMLVVDLSMALGAFLAGVLLAESEFRRELETDIEPFKGLLLGLFFMAVGMNIDFGVLMASPGMVAALLAGFLLIKLVVIYGLSRLMGLPLQERPVFTLLLAQGGEFAFVVFQTAVGARVFPAKTASLLIGAVTLSMVLGPLLLLLVDRFLLPRYSRRTGPEPAEISAPQEAPVIIAGFGRYGQIVGRTLAAQGIRATVLDHDAELIEQTRRFGFRVFYGDATRLDLLRMAGAAQAQVLVVAVDAPDQSLAIVDLAKQHFPQLQIVARARDVTHWYALRDRNVAQVQREVFESSLASARSVMELLGQPPEATLHAAERFRAHNLVLMEKMYPHHKDEAKLIALAKKGRQQLKEQMALERAVQDQEAAGTAAGDTTRPAG
jgi:glutathione-regulated potassium-efflux system ancillary protein KefC